MGEERPESFLLPRPIYPLPSIRYFSRLGGPYLMIISSGRYSRGRDRGEGEGRHKRFLSYLPLPPVHTHPHTHTHAHTHAWYTRVRECVGSACVMWVCMGVRVRRWRDIVGKGYRMALPRDYRNRAILYTFPRINQSSLRAV